MTCVFHQVLQGTTAPHVLHPHSRVPGTGEGRSRQVLDLCPTRPGPWKNDSRKLNQFAFVQEFDSIAVQDEKVMHIIHAILIRSLL